jgi:hypothetical protein
MHVRVVISTAAAAHLTVSCTAIPAYEHATCFTVPYRHAGSNFEVYFLVVLTNGISKVIAWYN